MRGDEDKREWGNVKRKGEHREKGREWGHCWEINNTTWSHCNAENSGGGRQECRRARCQPPHTTALCGWGSHSQLTTTVHEKLRQSSKFGDFLPDWCITKLLWATIDASFKKLFFSLKMHLKKTSGCCWVWIVWHWCLSCSPAPHRRHAVSDGWSPQTDSGAAGGRGKSCHQCAFIHYLAKYKNRYDAQANEILHFYKLILGSTCSDQCFYINVNI